jgi:ATP-dependent DNA helicase MPH1
MSILLDSQDSFNDDDDPLLEQQLTKLLDKQSTIEYKEIQTPNYSPLTTISKYLNYDNLNSIIYPTNFPIRDYQLEIVQKALFSNTLCAIPTGLGKTFIASTIMLNFFNWTNSQMKIIFMAPTKPLVAQQIKAFIQITGISMFYTDILLDKTKKNRKEIWDNKRILFTTPQVVENDLKNGILNPEFISCIIIDEAHRATGNYAYSNVIKYMNKFNSSFRVIALTATPGSDLESIQSVITNLNISEIDLRTESDPNISKYIKSKTIDKIDCPQTDEILTIIDLLSDAIKPILEKANNARIYDITDPKKINHFLAMDKSQKIIKNPTIPEGLKWSHYFTLQLLGMVGQCLRRLNIYGIKTFYNYFIEKYNEFTTKFDNKKSKNKVAASFYYHEKIKELLNYTENLFKNDKLLLENNKNHIQGVFSHTKFQFMLDELIFFFRSNSESFSSSCIIFTEYRESALEIVRVLENANKSIGSELLRPHIFIGQSKEKDKFNQEAYLDNIKPKRKKPNSEISGVKSKSEIKEVKRPTDRLGSSESAQLKGMNQKSQKELIGNFKSGIYNILVATSIGEEGLDIGEVDLIICFDSTQSPIKNIQRMGRTGRKRDGKVLLLFSSNERSKFDTAMDKYEWIQGQISRSSNLEYYDGSKNRIVPNTINPIIEYKFIEIPEENENLLKDSDIIDTDEFLKIATQTIHKKLKSNSKSKFKSVGKDKFKNVNDNLKQTKLEKRFFMPQNIDTGFKSVSKMVEKIGSKSNNSKANESIDLTNDSDFDGNYITSTNNDSTSMKGIVDRQEKILNDDKIADISGNISTNKANINFDEFSDDEFSEISFNELEKNALQNNSSNSLKRSFSELSSETFDDDIDDEDIIKELDRKDGQNFQRPAKR